MYINLILTVTSFLISLIFGNFFIQEIRKKKINQEINDLAPKNHQKKQGTPTMGGVIFIIPFIITSIIYFIFFKSDKRNYDFLNLIIINLSLILFGLIGFIDDYAKIFKKENEGLKPHHKIILQVFVAFLLIFLIDYNNHLIKVIDIPFFNISISINNPLMYLFLIFFIISVTNATNLTDGLDGLLGLNIIISLMFFTFLGSFFTYYYIYSNYSFILTGALFGFLYFNFYPAKVFMGDTGSLALGGFIAILSIYTNNVITFLLFGFIYFIEMLSVFIQQGYFKLSKKITGTGKRLLPMTPIHHSFENINFSENKIVFLFGFVNLIFTIIAIISIVVK